MLWAAGRLCNLRGSTAATGALQQCGTLRKTLLRLLRCPFVHLAHSPPRRASASSHTLNARLSVPDRVVMDLLFDEDLVQAANKQTNKTTA